MQRLWIAANSAMWLSVAFILWCGQLHAQALVDPPVPEFVQSEQPQAVTIRVALVDSGVNYLLPQIHQHLARSPSGELIGYDFWDLDERPFDAHPDARGNIQRHGTRTASIVMREAPFARLVPYRYPRPDMTRMTALVEHAVANNVRVIGLPLGGNRKEEWSSFEAAALANPSLLFVASAGNNGRDIDQRPVYPAALSLPNMLVVTSSDDFAALADGVNWGRASVDYMVPAERQPAVRFDGSEGLFSGSSYAVPRVVALAARLLKEDQSLTATDLIARIRSRFANGLAPRQIGQGYLYDPQWDEREAISIRDVRQWRYSSDEHHNETASLLNVPLDVFVLDEQWQSDVDNVLHQAQSILAVCGIQFQEVDVHTVQAKNYLKDLETGAARTLMSSLRSAARSREQGSVAQHARPVAVVFARDTRMSIPFDAEAFGQGNTRSRSWLKNSVWLTLALHDRSIALAHELFHVLANSGEHNSTEGNLMLARTTGSNTALDVEQCELIRNRSLEAQLAYPNR